MRVRIGIRNYLDLRHAYLDAQLKQLEMRDVAKINPLCHANPASGGHSHPFDMVGRYPFMNLGGEFVACLGCRSWMATHPHLVVYRNHLLVNDEIVGFRGDLPAYDLPDPRHSRERVEGQRLMAVP
ncbi:hypothetical protein BS329_38685 [Amycolatopsis coloradensis]|uniref:Uncharacterized protein n=2 Tax=Amycolatopsis coloradensis TaxID=76021 RepID=A0A1R0KEP1_9PSEU|nr:hypothetical protein BS329_38685 [Amycolatopsis coloradensis]